MTKSIRIENADTSDHKVAVYEENLVDDAWVRNPVPVALNYPTSMHTQSIWRERRLVIEEVVG